MQSYAKLWDDERKCYKNEPHHNWASNGADSFRMGIVGWRADADDRYRRHQTEMDFDPYRYELEPPIPEVISEFNPFDDPPHD